MLAVALATAGCGPTNVGSIAGYVIEFSGTREVEASYIKLLSVLPTPSSGTVGVAGATIAYEGATDSGFVTSGSGGYFEIKNLRPGTYTLSVSHYDYGGSYTITGTVHRGQTWYVGNLSVDNVRLLSIGISNYQHPSVPDLAGPVNDAEMLYEALDSGNTRIANAWLLTDAQATKQGIQEAIWAVTEGMTSGDTFVMTFAGHGTRDEVGNKEYIIPYDYSGNLTTAISDTELDGWLDSGFSQGKGVFIFDSCNSGGMASAASFLPRGMVLSTTFETMARSIAGNNRVVMTAATKYEESWESELPMSPTTYEHHGHFAYSFARGMWEAYNLPDTTTYPADSNPRDGQVSCQEAFDYANYFIDYQVDQCTWPVQTPQIFDPGNIADETYIFMY